MIKKNIAMVAALTMLCISSGAQADGYTEPAAASQMSCVDTATGNVAAGTSKYLRIPMARVAEGVSSDPTGIWGARIRNFNNPVGTDIWVGGTPLCDGSEVIVSQFVNRQCSSGTACPIRVIRQTRDGQAPEMLVPFKQACTDHERYAVRSDGRGIMTCNQQIFWQR